MASPEAAQKLESYIRRHEAIDGEISALRADRGDLRAEMKADGFVLTTIDQVLKRRRMEPDQVIEADALLEAYEAALGCGAAAAGVLTAKRGEDGTFEVRMVAGGEAASAKLSKATRARRDAVAMAELARQARGEP